MAGRYINITAEYARDHIHYDPETGLFAWKLSRSGRKYRRHIGAKNSYRHILITLDGHDYAAHRLAYLIMTGAWPTHEIDHKDGNPENNKWDNLRPCTKSENQQNKPANKTNTTGYKGVVKVPNGWIARIKCNNKRYFLGLFKTPEAASAAYIRAARNLHEEFAKW